MLVTIQTAKQAKTLSLPEDGRGAHWLADAEGNAIALAEAKADGWLITPDAGVSFLGGKESQQEGGCKIPFGETTIFPVRGNSIEATVLCRPCAHGDKTSRIIGFSRDVEVSIGRDESSIISYDSRFVSSHHAVLTYKDGKLSVKDCDSSNGVFVNANRIPANTVEQLGAGDVVTVLGLRVVAGQGFISLNNPQNSVTVKPDPAFVEYHQTDEGLDRHTPVPGKPYFYPALRFARFIERKDFVVEAPPQREKEDDTPVAMRVGAPAGIAAIVGMAGGLADVGTGLAGLALGTEIDWEKEVGMELASALGCDSGDAEFAIGFVTTAASMVSVSKLPSSAGKLVGSVERLEGLEGAAKATDSLKSGFDVGKTVGDSMRAAPLFEGEAAAKVELVRDACDFGGNVKGLVDLVEEKVLDPLAERREDKEE